MQGEAGVRPLPPGYLVVARELTAASGALLVLDEVQTGVGRTGSWFAFQQQEIGGASRPTSSRSPRVGRRVPRGGRCGVRRAGRDPPGRGQHGTTFGGNPVAAAAALATLAVIERDGLLANVRAVGEQLRDGIAACGNPWSPAPAATGCSSQSCSPLRSRPRWHSWPSARASSSTRCSPT
ncbi:aminotransferase class III-fold pyridoxal phosphate-dependent enzyme [Oerskovia sp. M15]